MGANDKRGQADMMCGLADIHVATHEFERAKEVSMVARDLYLDLNDNKGAQTALQLEWDAHIESFDGEEAMNAAQEMVKMFRGANDKQGEMEGMFLVCKTLFQKGDMDDLMKYGKDARALCQKASNIVMEGLVMDVMMKANITEGNNEEALKIANEAIELYKKAGHIVGEATALHAAAGIMLDKFFKESTDNNAVYVKTGFNQNFLKDYDLESYEKAIDMVNQAYELFVKAKHQDGIRAVAETSQNVTVRAAMMNDPDETRQVGFTEQDGWKLKEIVHKWYLKDEAEEAAEAAAALANAPAAE